MSTVVRKYGGSSLATVAQLRTAAGQISQLHRAGHDTVVVVSARGHTTDDLLRLAAEVGGPILGAGPTRELDQLLATGEGACAALFALAVRAHGAPAVSLTGPQAGVHADGEPGAGRVTGVRAERLRRLLA